VVNIGEANKLEDKEDKETNKETNKDTNKEDKGNKADKGGAIRYILINN